MEDEIFYTTPSGMEISQTDALIKWGDEAFDQLINDGQLTLIEDAGTEEAQADLSSSNYYETTNGETFTEVDLINIYGQETFNEVLASGQLKKKDSSGNLLDFGDTSSSLEATSESQGSGEQDYFTGAFGSVLKVLDFTTGLGLGDFIDDMARGIDAGFQNGQIAESGNDLLMSGATASYEDIQEFIQKTEAARNLGPSDEMRDYTRIYEEEKANGLSAWGFLKGLILNPTVIPEVMASSFAAMANADSAAAALAAVGTGAGGGATLGALAGGVGAAPGAVSGAVASLPYAFAAAGTVLETGLTFGELLQQQLESRDMDLTIDNVQTLLNNKEVYDELRYDAIARGVSIGAIDAFTGRLGGKVAAPLLRRAGGAGSKAASSSLKRKALGRVAAVEGVGGSLGEVAGITATNLFGDQTGQDYDVGEILMEGIAEMPGSIKDIVAVRYQTPKYKINGKKSTAAEVDDLIDNMSYEQLTAPNLNIQIENDFKGRREKLQDKILNGRTRQAVSTANPDLNETTLDAIVKLEREVATTEGKVLGTVTGKKKIADLKAQIIELQTNQLEQEAVEDTDQSASLTEEEKTESTTKASEAMVAEAEAEGEDKLAFQPKDPVKKEVYQFTNDDGKVVYAHITTAKDGSRGMTLHSEPVSSYDSRLGEEIKINEGISNEKAVDLNFYVDSEITLGSTVEGFENIANKKSVEKRKLELESRGDGLAPKETEAEVAAVKPFTTKRVKQPQALEVPGSRSVDVKIDADGKPIAISRRTGKPLDKTPAGAQKFMLERAIDINAGEMASIPKSSELNPEQYGFEVAEKSSNVREVSEAISNEEKRLNETTEEERRGYADPLGIESVIGEITEEEFSRYGDKNSITPLIRRYWFKKKPKAVTGKMFGDKGKGTLDADITALQGYTPEKSQEYLNKVIEFIIDHPTRKLDIDNRKSSPIGDLKIRFTELTGLQPTKKNIETVLAIDPNREPNTSIEEKSKDRDQKAASEPGVFGKKRGPKASLIVGDVDTSKKITMTEKLLYMKRLKDLNEGAKTAIKSFRIASIMLAKEITEMVKSGKITTKQGAAIINKFSKVNMLSDASINNFVEYMGRVFNRAEYVEQMSIARRLLKRAKKNIATKIGNADAIALQLDRIFAINPTLFPDSILDKYLSLLNNFSERSEILSPSDIDKVNKLTQEILAVMDEEFSKVGEISERFNAYEDKVMKGARVDFAATIKKMLKEELITEEEADILMKYKSTIVPSAPKKEKTQEQIQEEKNILIDSIKNSDALRVSRLSSKDERRLADKFESLYSNDEVLEGLSLKDLERVDKLIDNINNGYLPHLVEIAVEKMNAVLDGNQLGKALGAGKIPIVSKTYAKLKNFFTLGKRGAVAEAIRRNPLFYVDQVFGNYNGMPIFNSLFNKAAIASESLAAELKIIFGKIDKAEQAVFRSFKKDGNKTLRSKFKQMIYLIQLEYDSNIGNSEVNQASGFILDTIKKIDLGETSFSLKDAKMLEDIYDKYKDETGEIDIDKLYGSFNDAEYASIETVQEINTLLQPKAVFASGIIRGDRIVARDNYIHLNTLPDTNEGSKVAPSEVGAYSKSLRPSTKAKSLIKRTGNTSALNFDIYAAVSKGAKGVLIDYYLTEPIRTARRAIVQAEANLKGDKTRLSADDREKLNAVKSAFNEVVDNLLVNSYTESDLGTRALKWLQKNGYRAILASSTRWVAESTANSAFALITNPVAFIAGTKFGIKFLSSDIAPIAMKVLGSKQITRLYPEDGLTGRMVDSRLIEKNSGMKGGRTQSRAKNKLTQAWNVAGAPYQGAVSVIADGLISTPDKIVMRPMWFGKLSTEFKSITGQDIDIEKIAAEDQAYMAEFKDALAKATAEADVSSVMTGSTANPFMGILKGTSKPDQSTAVKVFNAFNNFMTTFLIYEYITARTGIMSAVGRGSLTKQKGAQLLAGAATRMVMYTMVAQVLGEALGGLAGEDEEDDKGLDKKLGQAMASSFSSMLLGRDFGNAFKGIINYWVEQFNKEYLESLREGEYDVFRDGIQYQIVPRNIDGKGTGLGDWGVQMAASLGPAVKTIDFMMKKASEAPKKTQAAQERRESEIYIRLPLELLGNAGMIPMYKDVRRLVLREIYSGMRSANVESNKRKAREVDLLQGYGSRSDMKRYDPRLWNDTFGPNSVNWDSEESIREANRELRAEKQRLKDLEYNYIPSSGGSNSPLGNKGGGSKSPLGNKRGKSKSPLGKK
tara:strand:+ start:3587 stop:10288 length:6702 start_codon:yes stop_codon:yes gene_type:complete